MMRPFGCSTELMGGVTVLLITGELDATDAPVVWRALDSGIASTGCVVIDLSGCDFIDSSGIASIVQAWQGSDGAESRGKVLLAGPRGQVERIIKVTGLDQHIAIFDEVEQAVASVP